MIKKKPFKVWDYLLYAQKRLKNELRENANGRYVRFDLLLHIPNIEPEYFI